MSATVRLGDGTAVAFDAIQESPHKLTRGVLLTLEGRTPGDVLNCALIPMDKIGAVIASLQLVAAQVK